jgi:hypothetical protein
MKFSLMMMAACVVVAQAAHGEDKQKPENAASPAPVASSGPAASEPTLSQKEMREGSSAIALFNYSALDMVIPSKWGVTGGWVRSAENTYDLEYLRGTVAVPFIVQDLGKMKDQRLSLMHRSFGKRQSFNVSYGLTYFQFKVYLGNDLLSRISGVDAASVDIINLQTLGFNLGIGNRWTFRRNIMVGIDWIQWSQPVFNIKRGTEVLQYVTNEQDREDIDDVVRILSYVPRFTLFKVQAGMSF